MSTVEAVFGPEFAHLDEEEAARKSSLRFVRGRSELGVFDATRNPTGHALTAWEAYQAYGLTVLEEAVEYGSAILVHRSGMEPTIDSRMENLGLTSSAVANETGLHKEVVEQAHLPSADNQVRDLERIGFVLGLDELQVGYRPIGEADADLAVRLKTLRPPKPSGSRRLGPRAVLSFAHAASVIRTQCRLQRWLGIEGLRQRFEPTDDYGDASVPAYKIGYELAEHARKALNLGDRPIGSMRELVEGTLGIPVIQAKLPESIAGATIAVNDAGSEARGIVLNTVGANQNVWVRRATLAHELGHLLFDPIQRLERVRVDTYQSNEIDPQGLTADYVEQRANAFAISFLAPMDAVRDVAPTPLEGDSIPKIMRTFGISHTAARYHIRNSYFRQIELPHDPVHAAPSDEQRAAENFTIDWFPIGATPEMRRGRFVEVVTSCFDNDYISDDSAARYMNCGKTEFRDNIGTIRGLYSSHQ